MIRAWAAVPRGEGPIVQATRRGSARVSLAGSVRRRVRHAVVGCGRAGSRGNATRAAAAEKCVPCGRVAVPGAARPPRAGPTVCVRHTARRRLWGVQLVRRLGAGCPARRSAGGGLCRLRSAVCAGAIAGLRGARRAFWSQGCASRCADFRSPTCGRVFAAFCVEPAIAESQPTELCKEPRHASRRGPNPSRGASAQRRARQDENKRTAARRRLHMEGLRREPGKGAGKGGCSSRNEIGGKQGTAHLAPFAHFFLRKRGREG